MYHRYSAGVIVIFIPIGPVVLLSSIIRWTLDDDKKNEKKIDLIRGLNPGDLSNANSGFKALAGIGSLDQPLRAMTAVVC